MSLLLIEAQFETDLAQISFLVIVFVHILRHLFCRAWAINETKRPACLLLNLDLQLTRSYALALTISSAARSNRSVRN